MNVFSFGLKQLLFLGFFTLCWSTGPTFAEIIEVPGLDSAVEIIVDKWGVPHIYAESQHDVFFAQGFNAARDRLWQMDLWRRQGLGRLASVLGHRYVARDAANRLFLYRGDMEQEWFSYGPDAKSIATAFTKGINAYIKHLETTPRKLPPEFQLLNYQPERWAPEDVVRIRTHGLWRNATSEILRAQIICQHGLSAASLWKRLEPHREPTIPNGFDPCSIPEDVLDVYRLAKGPLSFRSYMEASTIENTELMASIGSNNWVVAPSRTRKGSAILANDPHRLHAVPSVRYAAHLIAPDINIVGAGEPTLPGISIGHNEDIAFGLTIFAMDQEDLYYYPLDPSNPYQYVHVGKPQPLRRIVESIEVRDAEPVSISLEFTRHGPVVKRESERLYALRAGWLEPGMAPYFGSIAYMKSNNWAEFNDALNRWGGPAENHVYADTRGNIGYQPAGLFPRRENFDGLLPVPGDGEYEWNGFFDINVLPSEFNPDRGFITTANAMTLPADYPIDKYRIGFEWSSPWRQRRIENVLQRQRKHTLRNSIALQHDYQSVFAEQMLKLLPRRLPNEIKTIFEGWDAEMDARSSTASFFSIWYSRHLVPSLIETLFGNVTPVKSLSSSSVLELMQNRAYDELVITSLENAYKECVRLMGRYPERWHWGDLHAIRFEHPLYPFAEGLLKDSMELMSYPRGGSGNTTNSNGFFSRNLRVRSGASWRFVVDTGDWDSARMTNTPGQSGNPESPYYDNLLEDWANDRTFPLLFSRKRIEENAAFTINLVPSNKSTTE